MYFYLFYPNFQYPPTGKTIHRPVSFSLCCYRKEHIVRYNTYMMKLPDYVYRAMDALNQAGYECYVVGGAVRSAILHAPVHDYDLTTNALPQQMKEVFSSWHTFDTGIQHGTITVLSDHHPLEITTYRKDASYQDHRHPDHVEFTSALMEDCARRDFTINALCYHPKEGILDFYGGQKDIENRVIRCIGDPYRRFDEDALRILRAIRFGAQLQFELEEKTSQAILALKDTLTYVSAERISEEFTKYLCCDGCAPLCYPYRSVFAVFLPELNQLSKEQMQQLITRLQFSKNDRLIRMAILLSSPCFSDPHRILSRLKFSNNDRKTVLSMIALRHAPMQTRIDVRFILRDIHVDFLQYLQYREGMDLCRYVQVYDLYEQIIRNHDCTTLKDLALNGGDLVLRGYQGRQISETLNDLLKKVIEDVLPNDRKALLDYLSSSTR